MKAELVAREIKNIGGRGRGCVAYLAESAFAHGAVQVEVVEIDFAVEVDRLCTTAADTTHARGELRG